MHIYFSVLDDVVSLAEYATYVLSLVSCSVLAYFNYSQFLARSSSKAIGTEFHSKKQISLSIDDDHAYQDPLRPDQHNT